VQDYKDDKKKVDPVREWKYLQDARNFKTANSLYEIPRINEEQYIGDQWKGIDAKNLRRTTYNFIGQTTDVKVASILANELTIQRAVDDMDEDNEEIQQAVKAFNLADKKNWERLKMDAKNEQVVLDGAIQGIGVSYWWWDDSIKMGNSFVSIGDINGQLVDMIDLYVANPHEVDIQKQPWNKIVIRMTVSELRELAKQKGVPEEQIEMIMTDEEERTYAAFEKTDTEQDNTKSKDDLGTLVVNFKKIDDVIHSSLTTKNIVIEDWKDTELTRYPIAVFTYKPRKRFIYGEAEMTRYLENQRVVNLQQAARHKHALMLAIPKVLYNKNMLGSFSNAIGSVNPVNASPQTRIGDAMTYVQPTAMTIDVDKSVEEGITRTQDLAGVNQNIKGEARPENAAALLTQIKQANIPNETYKRRLYDYLEQVALIWEDFYKTKYNITRKMKDEEGEVVEFTGTDYADMNFTTRIDVGASTQWSEVTSTQFLMDFWDRGIIKNSNDIFKRIPSDLIKDLDGLIQENDDQQLLDQFIMMFMESQPPEVQQEMANLDPEQLKEAVKGMLGGQ